MITRVFALSFCRSADFYLFVKQPFSKQLSIRELQGLFELRLFRDLISKHGTTQMPNH